MDLVEGYCHGDEPGNVENVESPWWESVGNVEKKNAEGCRYGAREERETVDGYIGSVLSREVP